MRDVEAHVTAIKKLVIDEFVEHNKLSRCAMCGLYKPQELYSNYAPPSMRHTFAARWICDTCKVVAEKKLGLKLDNLFIAYKRAKECRQCGTRFKGEIYTTEMVRHIEQHQTR
jgi:hypothetical protein